MARQTRLAMGGSDSRRWDGTSGFVASLAETAPFLGRDLNVAGSQKIDLGGDALHLASEPVAEPAGEIDDATGEIALDALQVEDDGHVDLELVGHLLGVVERRRADDAGLGRADGQRAHDRAAAARRPLGRGGGAGRAGGPAGGGPLLAAAVLRVRPRGVTTVAAVAVARPPVVDRGGGERAHRPRGLGVVLDVAPAGAAYGGARRHRPLVLAGDIEVVVLVVGA